MEDIREFSMKYKRGLPGYRFFSVEVNRGIVIIERESFNEDYIGRGSIEIIDICELLGPVMFPPGLSQQEMEMQVVDLAQRR